MEDQGVVTWQALVGVALGVVGLVAGSWRTLHSRITGTAKNLDDKIDSNVKDLHARIDGVKDTYARSDDVNRGFDRMDKRLSDMQTESRETHKALLERMDRLVK